ncbi:MAG: hypothetical protein ABR600_01055 [Actinomycetota bacterium]
MTDSTAERLLQLASSEEDRLQRHLLVAAAIREAFHHDPIVVGGTAEEFWTAAEYHETDLDLCVIVEPEDETALDQLGFRRVGRHWQHEGSSVAVEFPDSRIDGDEGRTIEVTVGPGRARVIGLDDLYLDRLRQATMTEHEGVEFRSALAVVAARYDELDRGYIRLRIEEIIRAEALIGQAMKKVDSRIRRRVRTALLND